MAPSAEQVKKTTTPARTASSALQKKYHFEKYKMKLNLKKQCIFAALILVCGCATFSLVSCTKPADEKVVHSTPLRSIITDMDYGDGVYVIGHKSPDCDAVCSAITYASLIRRMGVNAQARVAGKVVCEPFYVLQEAGFQTPPVLEDATGLNMIMTDHSEYAQAVDGMAQARVLHVIDHHGAGSVTTAHPLFYYAMPIGSTCTIVASMYEELGEKPTATEARLMLSGLLSDTDKLSSTTTTDTDRRFYTWLLDRSDITDIDTYYAAMRKARTSFDGMTDEEILLSDYKEYEIQGLKLGIGSIMASEEIGLEELCRRMRPVMPAVREEHGLDMLFMMLGDRDAGLTHIPFCGDGAKEVAEYALKSTATEDGCIVTEFISSRKAQFVPAITEGIVYWKEKSDEAMKIQVSDGSVTIVFELNDTPVAKSLYDQLPLTVAVENYSSNEKIFYPPKALSTSGGMEGDCPAGTLAYFSPWGNVVMYYGAASRYSGLYILGTATEGPDKIQSLSGQITVSKV